MENRILNAIAQAIFNKGGSNILVLDVRNCSQMTDFVVIAEGNVDRHVVAIAKAVEEALAEKGMIPSYKEGLQVGDWVVLDYLHIMVHIFMPGIREKYQLEMLWKDADIVDVVIDVAHERSIHAS